MGKVVATMGYIPLSGLLPVQQPLNSKRRATTRVAPTKKEQMNVDTKIPQIRFPGFSGDWVEKKLGDVADKISSGKTKPTENGIYPVYGSTGVIGASESFTHKGKYILIARVGANAGRLNLVNCEFCVTDNTLILELKNNNGNIDFIYSTIDKFNLNRLVFGSGQPLVTAGQLKAIKINLPTLQEQEKIADFLSDVDSKIEKLSRKKDLMSEYKKGVMQKIFSQEIRFKDANSNDYPDWEEKKLGEVADVRDGTHESPKYHTEGYPLLTSKNLLANGDIDLENVSLISESDFISINKRSGVSIGDILFGMIGTIGNPVLLKTDGFAIKNVALIKEKKELKNIYLIHYLKSTKIAKQFYEQNTGGTQKFIALGVIRQLSIGLPCLEEQKKIAEFLTNLDKKIEIIDTELKAVKEFKKGLLQTMFV